MEVTIVSKASKGKLGRDTSTLTRAQLEAIEKVLAESSPVYTRPSQAI